ncbi:UDP-glucose 4-epimerase GalE [Virgibacillus profundi]|uniref:UDP-glucose 4-epimerase n=1 Tax=Virgibacillus profundi TaxID=2024555 RepID=A0A2A2IKC7_9BACI|nr:UDP-glucose 4-epimerase GalE [Virgibacillus profundi]PXY55739.1 UDP-glucose 4-epimerase GalE [Virgibacillus profundi]
MAVLVTGGAGYIGSHTCIELLNEGYKVIVLDNFSNSNPESLNRVAGITGKQLKIYDADLLDKKKVTEIFAENKIEAVIHLAGLKAVGESVSLPLKYFQNNIAGTIILCEVMQQYGVKNLVFSSSATVYGTTEKVPIDEEAILGAVNPYGRTKLVIEEILRDVSFSDQTWSIALLRYFNPIGAHQSGYIGEDPNGIPNNLMPYISQVAVGKRDQLTIFGDDYLTEDGTGVRDYIHVVDLALGHLKALERVLSTKGVDAYNLGTGKGYSVLEMVRAFEKASGKTVPYTVASRRLGDAGICYANPQKAKEKLGWQAKRGIDVMCEDAWRWQRNNPNGYERISRIIALNNQPVHDAAVFLTDRKA